MSEPPQPREELVVEVPQTRLSFLWQQLQRRVSSECLEDLLESLIDFYEEAWDEGHEDGYIACAEQWREDHAGERYE